MEKKEFLGIGRAYCLGILILVMMFILVLTEHLEITIFIEKAVWIVGILAVSKEGGKFAGGFLNKKPKGDKQ